MIVGLGLDVCEIARVRKSLGRHGLRFMQKVLTDDELAYCQRRRDPAVPFAGRFAAKEAAVKALGAPPELRWHDWVVVPADAGPPRLELDGAASRAAVQAGVAHVHLTITHDAGVAAAVVILER